MMVWIRVKKGSMADTLSKLALLAAMIFLSFAVSAERIKDLAMVQGVRDNQLVGYGLVVGLPGTGEKNSAFTEQTFATMLRNFGITVPAGIKLKVKNVAPVAVHATMPAFSKPGQTLDITISSIGEAKSLRGGSLLQTFMKGVDGNVYAIAQGSLVVSGLGVAGADGSKVQINTPTVGRIPNGAIIEREIPTPFADGDFLTFNLYRSDFSSAKRMSDAINALVGPDTAIPIDATSVKVYAPRDISQRVAYLSVLENIEFKPADESARIIINSRTGTIVIGKDVRLLSAAITHGSLTVTISENQQVSQPNALAGGDTTVTQNSIIDVDKTDSRMFKFSPGTTLDELVRAINQIGMAPGDLMSILEALKEAGAIHGQLIVI